MDKRRPRLRTGLRRTVGGQTILVLQRAGYKRKNLAIYITVSSTRRRARSNHRTPSIQTIAPYHESSPRIGLSEDNPAVLVVESREVKERAGNAVNSKELPEATTAMETHCVYYRVYDGVGVAISKTHFDEDDPSLGRVDILSIAPRRTVSSLKARLAKAQDHPGDDIQLFEDAGSDSPMGDNDVLTFLGEDYPGSTEEQPIAVVFKKIVIVNAPQPQPPAFSKKIRARITESYKHYPTNWLPITAGEVFLTDGIAIQHPGFPHDEHRFKGYMASNSGGQTGFVGDYASEFC